MTTETYSAEEGILGYIMLFSPDALALGLGRGLTADWFTEPKAQIVWAAMEEQRADNLGVHTHLIAGRLAKKDQLREVTLPDIARMLDYAYPTALSFGDSLASMARDHAARVRGGLWQAGRIAGTEGDKEREHETSNRIAETFQAENPPETLQQAAAAFATALDGGSLADYGLATGLIDIDRTLGTLQPGELIVVAARPGCGKSSLLRQIGIFAARDGRGVSLVSTEMGAAEIMRGAAKQVSCIPWSKDRTLPSDQAKAFRATVLELSSLSSFRLIEVRSLAALIARWRAMMAEEYPPSLFVVDYLQQLDAGMRKGETLASAVGRISSELKAFAKEFRVVVLAAAQLNRESAKEGEPQLYHLRDSGAIEQDADRVIMLKVADSDIADARLCTIEVFQRKNRNGPLGMCRLIFDRWTTRFSNHI